MMLSLVTFPVQFKYVNRLNYTGSLRDNFNFQNMETIMEQIIILAVTRMGDMPAFQILNFKLPPLFFFFTENGCLPQISIMRSYILYIYIYVYI